VLLGISNKRGNPRKTHHSTHAAPPPHSKTPIGNLTGYNHHNTTTPQLRDDAAHMAIFGYKVALCSVTSLDRKALTIGTSSESCKHALTRCAANMLRCEDAALQTRCAEKMLRCKHAALQTCCTVRAAPALA